LIEAATAAKLFEQTPGVRQNTRVGLYVSIFWFRGLVLGQLVVQFYSM